MVSAWLRPLTLDGAVHGVHVASSVLLVSIAAAYLAYLVDGGLLSSVRVTKAKHRPDNERIAWKRRNIRLYQMLYGLLAALAATGLLLYWGWSPFGVVPLGWITTVHLALAWAVLATVGLHVLAQYKFGASAGRSAGDRLRHGGDWLLKILRPRFAGGRSRATLRAHPVTVAIGVAAAAMAGGGFIALDRGSHADLEVVELAGDPAPVLDGVGEDPVWKHAPAASVLTYSGANLAEGASQVEVQAATDGASIFLKFRWEDPTRSLTHLPLEKTADGWRLVHTAYDIEDEDVYYEDKFAVLLTTWSKIAGGVTHLGRRPLDDMPSPLSGRGLHYTEDGSIADMWQWKAVRSQPLGGLDDDFFGPPAEPKPEEVAGEKRYKGGYVTDEGEIDSYNNFAHEGPGGYGGEVLPKRLPRDLAALQERLGTIDLDPDTSDTVPLYMTEGETAEYVAELDAAIPVGTIIPGIVVKDGGGIHGDRGDVRTGARWEDGWWTLEVARRLDTGSPNDTAFLPGRTVYLWVAVFDRTQTRHTRHMRPLAVRLPEPPAGV